MKHLLLTVLLFSLTSACLIAQQLTNEVISVGGGSDESGNIRLDWTLGELAVQEGRGRTQRFTEGFHQPVILIEQVEIISADQPISEGTQVNTLITLSPNPVNDLLTIHFEHAQSDRMKCQVLDASGNPHLLKTYSTKEGDQFLDLSTLAPGLVFIQFIPETHEAITVFKLVKI